MVSLLTFRFHMDLPTFGGQLSTGDKARLDSLLWPPYVIEGTLYFCPVVSFYLSSIFFFFSFLT